MGEAMRARGRGNMVHEPPPRDIKAEKRAALAKRRETGAAAAKQAQAAEAAQGDFEARMEVMYWRRRYLDHTTLAVYFVFFTVPLGGGLSEQGKACSTAVETLCIVLGGISGVQI